MSGATARRWLQRVADQQGPFTTDAEHGHDPQAGADGRPGVIGFDSIEGGARDSNSPGHSDRTQALRLAQALEAVTQLQEQMADHPHRSGCHACPQEPLRHQAWG